MRSRRSASLGRRPHPDIEVPPTATSFATNYYTDGPTRLKMAAEHRRKTLSLQRMHWKTTPNAYQREEIEEIGTTNPKKIMHWTEGGKKTTGGTVLASEDPHQFAPQGSDPREFQANLKKVRDNYYKDVRTAGPQSKILDGLDLDDVDAYPGSPTVSVFSPNPFGQVTDDDLARYKRNIERKAKGLPTEEEEEAMERQRRAATLQPDSSARVVPEPQRSLPFFSLLCMTACELILDYEDIIPSS
ncbi:unnamed protein product [Dibothriocephalus latus]|uniref:Uncharacterized protein n=1 Tax=Dibothriocephalus latus TaxID=60516 RepID=A0A3P7LUL0_DIBLA|nr:unnamed protein product [Dibothriocephalus latus]